MRVRISLVIFAPADQAPFPSSQTPCDPDTFLRGCAVYSLQQESQPHQSSPTLTAKDRMHHQTQQAWRTCSSMPTSFFNDAIVSCAASAGSSSSYSTARAQQRKTTSCLRRRSHSTGFTRAQGVPECKIELERGAQWESCGPLLPTSAGSVQDAASSLFTHPAPQRHWEARVRNSAYRVIFVHFGTLDMFFSTQIIGIGRGICSRRGQ